MGITTSDMLEEDRKRHLAIMNVDPYNPVRLASLVHAYYQDGARSDRTPREVMYLHMGMLIGTLVRLARFQ